MILADSSISIVVMAKAPEPGRTKTRLSPPLTPGEAAGLYSSMLLDTISRIGSLSAVDLWLAYTPDEEEAWFRQAIAPSFHLMAQRGDDLGQRMHRIIEERHAGGASGVVVVGTDLPTLPIEYVSEAIDRLQGGAEIILGPSEDGGYYLVGMREPDARLFEGISWSRKTVLRETVDKASELEKAVVTVPSWYDIDTPPDLDRLKRELENLPEDDHYPRHTADFLRWM
jgi:hypothetical protein